MDSFQFTTPVAIPKADFNITHQQPILLFGSCFTESVGQKLLENKFDVTINPNGIIYNPISVIGALKRVVDNQPYTENELLKINNKWISLNHHGSFSSFDKVECLSNINYALTQAHQKLVKTKTLIITFGSAWVYEHPTTGIVANCHKIPTKEFKKRVLTVKEILTAFDKIKEVLKSFNIVFTVSPVRHINDGLHENSLSKSVLHIAINNIVEQNNNASYFPSYELAIDELRDYRFFKDDLVHPTKLAIDYIWKKFAICYFNEETKKLNSKIEKIKAAANHKPFNFNSDGHQQFIKKQLLKMEELTSNFPFLDFEKEKVKIKGR